jgi:excisionase family DNA binding protein
LISRRETVISLRAAGLAQSEIGKLLGVSGERVRQILHGKTSKKSSRPNIDLPLSTGDVARMLNIHTNTVRRWCQNGILKPYRIGPRGDRRFRRRDVDKLLREPEP